MRDKLLPIIHNFLKEKAKSLGGTLLTPEITNKFFILNETTWPSFEYEVSDFFTLKYEEGNEYFYSNVQSATSSKDNINELRGSKDWKEVTIDKYLAKKPLKVGKIKIDYEIYFIGEKGRPAVIEKNISDFTSPETFNTFGGLYENIIGYYG